MLTVLTYTRVSTFLRNNYSYRTSLTVRATRHIAITTQMRPKAMMQTIATMTKFLLKGPDIGIVLLIQMG